MGGPPCPEIPLKLLKQKHVTGPANWLFDRYSGGSRRPVFFDIDKTFPALREVERACPVIREELEAVLPTRASIPRYHEIDEAQRKISAEADGERSWRVFMLYVMGLKPEKNRARCPRTAAILDRVPNLFQAFFSILDGGKSIPPHHAPYRGYLRFHLGLKVPKEDPPTIRVKDQHYTWKEGEAVLFDDSWQHEVTNRAKELRAVLVVDVMRPMPRLPHAVNSLILRRFLESYRKKVGDRLDRAQAPPIPL
jgi:aspartyl/asparaginyl beta-hydroxylase (cupin superfamily)